MCHRSADRSPDFIEKDWQNWKKKSEDYLKLYIQIRFCRKQSKKFQK
jgi:hypothetical protein